LDSWGVEIRAFAEFELENTPQSLGLSLGCDL
jgi:hypothetical protein